MKKEVIFVGLFFLFIFLIGNVCAISEVQKVLPFNTFYSVDKEGESIAVYGNYLFVGVPDDHNKIFVVPGDPSSGAYGAGAVYIYKKNLTGQFKEFQVIYPNDLEASDFFGKIVSASANYLAVANNYGEVYIFKQNSTGQFKEIQKITDSDSWHPDVLISGDFLYLGNPDSSGASVYVYKRDSSTGLFQKVQELKGDVKYNSRFGSSVSVSGNYLAAGAMRDGVYIFKRNSAPLPFERLQKLNKTNMTNGYGFDVLIVDNYLLVKAFYEPIFYIYEKNSSGYFEEIGNITMEGNFTSPFYSSFSFSITNDKEGNYYILIGDPRHQIYSDLPDNCGAVHIFKKNSTEENFRELGAIKASNLFVKDEKRYGCENKVCNESNARIEISTDVFNFINNPCGDYFGTSISVKNGLVFISAPQAISFMITGAYNQYRLFKGAVYIFDLNKSEDLINNLYIINDSSIINDSDNHIENLSSLVKVFSPESKIYNTSIILFNITSNESVSKLIINFNGTNITLENQNTSFSFADGIYNLIIYTNESGNITKGNLIFGVDTVAPLLNINSSSESGLIITTSEKCNCEYSLKGRTYKINSSDNFTHLIKLNLSENNTKFLFVCRDLAGNLNSLEYLPGDLISSENLNADSATNSGGAGANEINKVSQMNEEDISVSVNQTEITDKSISSGKIIFGVIVLLFITIMVILALKLINDSRKSEEE